MAYTEPIVTASNSLLESLVFAKRAAGKIQEERSQKIFLQERDSSVFEALYQKAERCISSQEESLAETYKREVLCEIERGATGKMNEITMNLNADHLIRQALQEGILQAKDITTNAVMRRKRKRERCS